MTLALRYLGHREGASLGYYTGAVVTLRVGEVFVVPPEGLVLGRGPKADLRVASSQVARLHARVVPEGDGLVVTDLCSTNGTQVERRDSSGERLRPSDRLTLAEYFDFEVVELP